jgi:hypothetical protein
MLIVTALWPVAMVSLGDLSFVATYAGAERQGEYYYPDGMFGPELSESAMSARAFGSAVWSGFCCPTTLYGIARAILLVVWFATKNGGNERS